MTKALYAIAITAAILVAPFGLALPSCLMLANAVVHPGQSAIEMAYAGSRRVLILGDAPKAVARIGHTLGARVADAVPNAAVYSTDLKFIGTLKKGNLVEMHLDHLRPLPFEDNFFDRISMPSGLCLCRSQIQSCGGVATDYSAMLTFLREIARVLNSRNPSSRAYLEGGHGHYLQTVAMWKDVSKALELEHPEMVVEVVEKMQGSTPLFGLVIRPR
jgi:hypothetical protein